MVGKLLPPLFEIDFDLSDIQSAVAKAQVNFDRAPERMVRAAAREGLEEAVRTRRYHDRTHDLTTKARARLEQAGSRFASAFIEWPVPYASFVDAGTRPHPIVAKAARGFVGPLEPGQGRSRRKEPAGELVFFWTRMGRWFRGRRVNHPGTRAYGFAGVAVQKAERVLEREFELACKRAEAALSG